MTTIRRATLSDLDALIEGNQGVAFETEALKLYEATLRPGITAILDDSNKGVYWVAVRDAQVVGQTLITYEWSDWRCAPIWWLQSVYVWPAFRGQGVFRALLVHIESEARKVGAKDIRLYADTSNDAAKATYGQLGFTTGHYQVFEKPLAEKTSGGC
jgi:GNAT superfamily N-acetyltransferase